MKSSSTKVPNGHGSLYKEVRFSPTVTPIRLSHSLPSAGHPNLDCARAAGRSLSADESYSALSSAYLEQSQQLLQHQRQNFENERVLFAEERRLWGKERALLQLRISELESLLKGVSDSNPGHHHSQPDASFPADQSSDLGQDAEGQSRPTRVFRDTNKVDGFVIPTSVSERASFSLGAAFSVKTRPLDPPAVVVSVPIEKLDSRLDGITLKSSGLPPEIVARVMTPPSPSPLDILPSIPPSMERKNSFKLKLSDLGPPDKNLIRDAGHTPMAVIEPGLDAGQQSTGEATPHETPAKAESIRPPESSASYFPEVPDDPALKGPLSLLNDEDHDRDFLNQLNQKLMDQSRQDLDVTDSAEQTEAEDESSCEGELDPELRFKNTTNFGTAFGAHSCGEP